MTGAGARRVGLLDQVWQGLRMIKRPIPSLAALSLAVAPQALASDSAWPNKPSKKPEARLIVGAQAGSAAPKRSDVVIGAGGVAKPGSQGDLGFTSSEPVLQSSQPRRAVGYDTSRRIGNNAPSS